MEHPAGVRGTVRIEQPRVPVGKPERKAEEIQPVLLGRKRGFLTDAFPDQIAARHEHPGGDFRAGEVTGAAAEQVSPSIRKRAVRSARKTLRRQAASW